MGMAALSKSRSALPNQNEEADRIDIDIQALQRVGCDPQAVPAFSQKLSDQSSCASKPPEIPLTTSNCRTIVSPISRHTLDI
jgi:predicted Zn-dependent protease